MIWQGNGRTHTAIVPAAYAFYPTEKYRKGLSATFSKLRCNERSELANIKALLYQPFYSAYQKAVKNDFDEAMLLNKKGELAEGSRSNIFFVKDGVLLTPGVQSGCLEGVTRRCVIDLAKKKGVAVKLGRFKPDELLSADEAFLTNSLWGIMPLARLDGRLIGSAVPGPLTAQLQWGYRQKTRVQ
jgi:branched-subunit amino acid aminotransferase/4-amino-4-deoxychorismate lyase